MTQPKTSNSRILKNTVMLYFRMALLMVISFYTSRVVLNALGVDDYGIYNVVGGIVAMFSFVNSSMTVASNRFLAFAIGKDDVSLLKRTYSTSVIIHAGVSLLVVVLGETAGLWYFYHWLNVPESSRVAAMWVYQLSIVSAVISINNVPIMALVTAHEDMTAYAYVSLLEGFLKLGIAFLLSVTVLGNLTAYAIMMALASAMVIAVWRIYAHRKYPHCRFTGKFDKPLFKELYGFIGWQLVGGLSWILRNQGVSLVLNFFFGPALNTARALAVQVNGGITGLVGNFQMATNPQLVKNYAAGDLNAMQLLLFRSSKMSFMLLFVAAFPVLIEAEPLLRLWLKEIPDFALLFVQLIIIATLIDSLSGTMQHTALATGKIKKYTQIVTTILLSDILFVYIAFRMGFPPEAMIYVEMVIYFMAFIARLLISRKLYGLSISGFLRHVTQREVLVVASSAAVFLLMRLACGEHHLNFIIEFIALFAVGALSCAFIGLTRQERQWAFSLISSRLRRKTA